MIAEGMTRDHAVKKVKKILEHLIGSASSAMAMDKGPARQDSEEKILIGLLALKALNNKM